MNIAANKTAVMPITRVKLQTHLTSLPKNYGSIPTTIKYKYLGIQLDYTNNPKCHIEHTLMKAK